MSHHRNIAALVVAVLILGGCVEQEDCLGITSEVRPPEATLSIGESFTPRAFLMSCDGGVLDELDPHWSATDTAVVRVDSITGRVTAVGIGFASVVAVDSLNGPAGQSVVEVRAP